MTQHYIGIKQVTAWEQDKDDKQGYSVKYPDGYISWSPKDTFENAYIPQGNDPTKINQQMVDDFIVSTQVETFREKTTIMYATLANGLLIIESSSCVDPANYDESIGEAICIERIKDKVWNHLGFVLQWAKDGI
jgi:hypothetical protein